MNYEKIGNFIQEKRKEKELTQKELANRIGVTDKAISKWERGLGCPDVSILETLAKELDVSILEILKGRKIENEVIQVTEANDYIKETINYAKLSKKQLINKIISFLIIGISVLLLILNIENIIRINKKYTVDFGGSSNSINDIITKIENNINIIKSNQGIYDIEDYKEICNRLDYDFTNYIKKIKDSKLTKLNEEQRLSLKDIAIIDNEIVITQSLPLDILVSKYNISNNLKLSFSMSHFVSGILFQEMNSINNLYKYQLFNDIKYSYGNLFSIQKYDFQNALGIRITNIQSYLIKYLYLTEVIIKAGEINE